MTDISEQAIRRELAACYRLVAHFGWDDLVATHISARIPGTDDHFLVNPFGMMFDEITASSLIKIDLDGNILDPGEYPINQAAFVIHSAIHQARPDVGCAIHLHTVDGSAVSSTKAGVLPLNQTTSLFFDDIAYHDYEGIAFDIEERVRLQADLGNCNLMILRNHGTLTVGHTIASAFYRMYLLEWACTAQVRTLSMGLALHPIPDAVLGKVSAQVAAEGAEQFALHRVWPGMLRKVERLYPGFDA